MKLQISVKREKFMCFLKGQKTCETKFTGLRFLLNSQNSHVFVISYATLQIHMFFFLIS